VYKKKDMLMLDFSILLVLIIIVGYYYWSYSYWTIYKKECVFFSS